MPYTIQTADKPDPLTRRQELRPIYTSTIWIRRRLQFSQQVRYWMMTGAVVASCSLIVTSVARRKRSSTMILSTKLDCFLRSKSRVGGKPISILKGWFKGSPDSMDDRSTRPTGQRLTKGVA